MDSQERLTTEQLIDSLRDISFRYSRYTAGTFFRFAKSRDLSPAQLGALLHLRREGEPCDGDEDFIEGVADLGEKMFVTSAAASQMVDRLVQAGVVERVEDESDRRAKRLCLTPRGARVLDDFGRERQAWIVALAKRLSPEESEIVQSALRIVVEKTKTMSKEKTEE